jgi:hypothetical protein
VTHRDEVVALLVERGAHTIDHPGGTLLEHLLRTRELLGSWNAPHDLLLAGLAHAAYGTDGFAIALFALDERDLVREAIGEEAEALVYRYASCDRHFTLPQIGCSATPVAFRNRFTGADEMVESAAVRQFAELTFANELDLVRHSESFKREHGAAIGALFEPWKGVVSPSAYDMYRRLLGPNVRAIVR